MGNAGHPHAHLARALDRGLKLPALAAAAQLGQVPLEEALLLTLLLVDEPARYRKAAARWHARLVLERKIALEASHAVLGLLHAIGGEEARGPAALALAGIVSGYGMRQAAAKLDHFADGRWPHRQPTAA
jgi:hypothetical protein